jgi:hypothetical protein
MISRLTCFIKNKDLLIILLCVTFAIPLVSYGLMGSYMRSSGDDYCYGMVLTQHGFWNAQIYSYLHETVYHSNRYSLTLLNHISDLMGPRGAGVYPGLAVVGWVFGLTLTLIGVAKWTHLSIFQTEALLYAEAIVFFSLYQAPILPQILYWRAAMFGYLAPLVLNAILVGGFFSSLSSKKFSWISAVFAVFIALLAGGCTETGAVVQFFLWIVVGGIIIWRKRKGAIGSIEAAHGFWLIGIILIGTILSALLLALSPNSQRLMSLQSEKPNLITVGLDSARYSMLFIQGVFHGVPVPNLINFLLFIILGFINAFHSKVQEREYCSHFVRILLAYLVGYGLMVASIVPIVLTQGGYPSQRVLFIPSVILVMAVSFTGWIVGRIIYGLLNLRIKRMSIILISSMIVAGMIGLYPIYATRNVVADWPKYKKWSQFWDRRDQEIRAAKARGVLDIEIMVLDHIIPDVAELNENPANWYNSCAAGYYGVRSIRADLPGWDE